AIELDPDFAFPYYNLALALRSKGDIPGALAKFDKALELYPEHTYSHFQLARTLARQNDLKGAEDHLREVIRYDPNHGQAYLDLGMVLRRSGNLSGAVGVYRTFNRRFPNSPSPEGYDGLLIALIQQKLYVEAVREYDAAVVRTTAAWKPEAQRMLRYNAACAA